MTLYSHHTRTALIHPSAKVSVVHFTRLSDIQRFGALQNFESYDVAETQSCQAVKRFTASTISFLLCNRRPVVLNPFHHLLVEFKRSGSSSPTGLRVHQGSQKDLESFSRLHFI